jgi:poly-gamma-glutamate synthesis protein (capsule biosynthesis protein)
MRLFQPSAEHWNKDFRMTPRAPRREHNFLELFIVFVGVFAVVLWNNARQVPVPAFVQRVIAPLATRNEPVTLLFAGDVMLGRHVGKLIATHGTSYPFERIAPSIEALAPDIFVANLEGPITTLNAPDMNITPERPYSMRFSFDPSVADILKNVGFTHLSVANNHTFDQGGQGARDTLVHLTDAGIAPFGSYDGTALGRLATTTINGHDLAFIGLDTTVNAHDRNALAHKLGTLDPETFIVAFLHWGNEYEHMHSPAQESFAHFLIDNGVDLIVGSHPHVVQDVETYNGKQIYYSLGNFVFDQYWNDAVQTGLMVKVTLDGGETVFEDIAVGSVRSQPFVKHATSTVAEASVD